MIRKILLFSVLSIAAISTPAGAATHALVPRAIFLKALRVDRCEESNWHYPLGSPWALRVGRKFALKHSRYFGGEGWLDATWTKYRLPGFPRYAYQASPQQQARAMLHFVATINHGYWPDQTGCTGGY